ncbi:hypothetical protein RB623_12680 [Mesorhizobium sp. LHD-90]|uniref:hypothetical protein n=1 Tax=Mesorhizobium sp. LHD-90 TaxID=3071414 RepID=UPI0027E147EE|nr:hypothetical protein [Mesorhizobium sp. LHD-90]MDQ6434904.1 hypothetical protein [Mesorhizobium sp. LHD-90]
MSNNSKKMRLRTLAKAATRFTEPVKTALGVRETAISRAGGRERSHAPLSVAGLKLLKDFRPVWRLALYGRGIDHGRDREELKHPPPAPWPQDVLDRAMRPDGDTRSSR